MGDAMLQDAFDSLNDVFSPPFRGVMLKSVALTIAVLALGGFALDRVALHFIAVTHGWLATVDLHLRRLRRVGRDSCVAGGAGDFAGGELLSRRHRRAGGARDRSARRAGPARRRCGQASISAVRFAALTLAVMLAALVLLFLPGVGFAAWFGANAYLLGREYFELAAMRFRSAAEAQAMRRYFAVPVFMAGLIVAAFVSVPILNLATPLFATALMARLHKRLEARALAPSRL